MAWHLVWMYYWYVIVSEAIFEHLSLEFASNELPEHNACNEAIDCLTQTNAASDDEYDSDSSLWGTSTDEWFDVPEGSLMSPEMKALFYANLDA